MVLLPSQSEPALSTNDASFTRRERRGSIDFQDPIEESQELGFAPASAFDSLESSRDPSRLPVRLGTAPAATATASSPAHVQIAQRLYEENMRARNTFAQGKHSTAIALTWQAENLAAAKLEREQRHDQSAKELLRIGTPRHLNISGSPSFRHLHQDAFKGSPGFCGRHSDLLPLPKCMTPDPETGFNRMHSGLASSHSAAALSEAGSAFYPGTGTMRMRHVRQQQSLANLHVAPASARYGGTSSRGSGGSSGGGRALIATPGTPGTTSLQGATARTLSYGKEHEAMLRALASLSPPHLQGRPPPEKPTFEGQEILGARVPLYSTLRRAPMIKRQGTSEGVVWRQDIKGSLLRKHELPTNDMVDRELQLRAWREQQGTKGPREYTRARDDPVPRCISRERVAVYDPDPGLVESRRIYAAALA